VAIDGSNSKNICWIGPRSKRGLKLAPTFHNCTSGRGTNPMDGSKLRPMRL